MRLPLGIMVVFCALSAVAPGRALEQRAALAPLAPLAELASPAGAGSAQPNLFADARGRVWMSWLEPRAEGGRRLRLSSLTGTAWSAPVTVAEGANLLANWADFPSVFVTSRGVLAVHWLETAATRGAYGVRLATSADDGRTWTPVVTPHRDTSASEHGFVSFFEMPDGSVGLIWLDGREMAAHGGGHGAGGAGGPSMTLRATTIAKGQPGDDVLVDPRVCDCCQTSAAQTADGAIVAYRDRSPEEIRDIAVGTASQRTVERAGNGLWRCLEDHGLSGERTGRHVVGRLGGGRVVHGGGRHVPRASRLLVERRAVWFANSRRSRPDHRPDRNGDAVGRPGHRLIDRTSSRRRDGTAADP